MVQTVQGKLYACLKGNGTKPMLGCVCAHIFKHTHRHPHAHFSRNIRCVEQYENFQRTLDLNNWACNFRVFRHKLHVQTPISFHFPPAPKVTQTHTHTLVLTLFIIKACSLSLLCTTSIPSYHDRKSEICNCTAKCNGILQSMTVWVWL